MASYFFFFCIYLIFKKAIFFIFFLSPAQSRKFRLFAHAFSGARCNFRLVRLKQLSSLKGRNCLVDPNCSRLHFLTHDYAVASFGPLDRFNHATRSRFRSGSFSTALPPFHCDEPVNELNRPNRSWCGCRPLACFLGAWLDIDQAKCDLEPCLC